MISERPHHVRLMKAMLDERLTDLPLWLEQTTWSSHWIPHEQELHQSFDV